MAEDRPVFALDHEEMEALFKPQPNVGNIYQLRSWFVDYAARSDDSLPFPPDLLDHISDAQVSTLQNIFDINDVDRYTYWRYVYSWAIWRYKAPRLADEAAAMQQAIREAVTAEYLPEVFFLVCASRYRREKADRELAERKWGMWDRANQRARDNSGKLKASIQQVEKVLSLMDEDVAGGRMSRLSLPNVVRWCKENDFESKLAELYKVIEADHKETLHEVDQMFADVKQDMPREIAEDMPDCVYQAVDRVASIIQEIKNTKTMKISAATQLFGVWGLVVDQGALKQARAARKKSK